MSEPTMRIGPYLIDRPLGQGGMGIVYRAKHDTTHARVAIKTVRMPHAHWLASIRREIHALTRVRHPGVVRIVDQGVHHGRPWYAMDLLEGQTLRDYGSRIWRRQTDGTSFSETVDSHARTASDLHGTGDTVSMAPAILVDAPRQVAGGQLQSALTLVHRLCTTLAFLHGEGIVHRDLKPENVFVLPDETPVLVDFGVMLSFPDATGRERLDAPSGVAGTWAYMAPEQIRDEFVDARADLYSLGCMLYEILAGRHPFDGTPVQVLRKHLTEVPAPLSTLVQGVPEELEALLGGLLAKRQQDRIGYASDVAARLAELGAQGGRLVVALRPSAYLYRPSFAGRVEALRALDGHLSLVGKGHGGLVLIGGESGVGKTRFAAEVACSAMRGGMQVVTGECLALSATVVGGMAAAPLHPLRPLLQAVADRCQEEGRKATDQLLGPRGPVLALYEPALQHAPGLESQPAPMPLPADAARQRLFRYLAETLKAMAVHRAVLLILDDLQWADELSLGFLKSLDLSFLESTRVLILGTYRTEDQGQELRELARMPHVTRLALGRLDSPSVSAMVRDMLALPAPPDALVRFLSHQSEGNPFFVAEYLRSAVNEQIFRRDERGTWRVAEAALGVEAAYAALPLPGSLRELIGRRLDGLASSTWPVLEMASVLGREMDLDLLLAAVGTEDARAMDAVGELMNRQVMEQGAGGRLRFAHDKLREIAYERIEMDRRGVLHRAAAEMIEGHYRDAPDFARFYPSLGHHYAMAHLPERAVPYLTQAGDQARATYANDEAIALYRKAAAEVKQMDWREAATKVHESLGDVLALTGRRDEARTAYQEALVAAQRLAQPIRCARLHRKIGKSWETQHRHKEALESYGVAETTLGPEPAQPDASWWEEWIQIQTERIWSFYWTNQVDEMSALLDKVRPVIQQYGTPGQRAKFFENLVIMSLRRDRYVVQEETLNSARASLTASEEARDMGGLPMARFGLGFTLMTRGDLEEAEGHLSRALAMAEQGGDVTLQARCLTYLTLLHRKAHRVAETRRYCERSLTIATTHHMRDYIAMARANLAWLALQERDRSAVETHGQAALELWRGLTLVSPLQWTARLPLLEVKLAQDQVAEAIGHAQALLDSRQQRMPEAMTALLAQAIERFEQGDPSAAADSLRQGMQLFQR